MAEQFNHSQHTVERGADFVAHVREKLRFRVIRDFRLLQRLPGLGIPSLQAFNHGVEGAAEAANFARHQTHEFWHLRGGITRQNGICGRSHAAHRACQKACNHQAEHACHRKRHRADNPGHQIDFPRPAFQFGKRLRHHHAPSAFGHKGEPGDHIVLERRRVELIDPGLARHHFLDCRHRRQILHPSNPVLKGMRNR